MIVLDTSILIDSLTGPKASSGQLMKLLSDGTILVVPSLVLYEWLRGPRTAADLGNQETLFPSANAVPFGPDEATLSARLYRSVARARSREIDIGIAATAIRHKAQLWTRNRADFADIPGLRLYMP